MKCKKPNKCWCKSCEKQWHAGRYQREKKEIQLYVKTRRKELTAWIRSLKEGKACADCKLSYHFSAMQYDHTRNDKLIDIASMANRGYKKEKILIEINKCELVCANCHAVRTYKRRVSLRGKAVDL